MGIGDSIFWMIIFTVVFISYVVLGGQNAVIKTDGLQAIIIYAGILTALGVTLWKVGGFGGLQSVISTDHLSFPLSSQFGMSEMLTYLLIVGSTYVVGPDIYSRLFCAKDSRTARKSVFWAAGLLVPIAFAITLIGMGALVLFPQIGSEQAFPTIIKEIFPPVVGGLVIAALVSAVMSSADTTLLSASTILTVDIVGHFKPSLSDKSILTYSRAGLIILGLISLGLALALQGIISALMFAYTIYTCGVIIPVVAGFYKHKLKVTPLAALIAITGGGFTGLLSKILHIPYLDLGAFFLSGFLLFSVSIVENNIKARKSILRQADEA